MRIFKEEQRFTQLWIIVVLVMSSIVPLVLSIRAYNNNEMSLKEVIISASSIILLSFLFIFVFKLTTKIDEKGVHYKFSPMHFSFKLIKWNEMEKVYTRKYDALSEYGGWGCKGGIFWKKENGVAYNVSGDEGLQIITKEGKKILIGTQQINKVNQCINHYYKTKETND
ncbi:hypothetical protein EV195_10652 [Tenacibaculum skagerrakense]|uniref:PH (Pleckstrin Homology) domain-containing protein n=1 Tax=Tenacibaculum skagerrakense TaxID=186571 RepID=A0A4R2NQY2_9FLAO|nr:hypothetical protein [Tenacibaculum skagerrakense]TCP24250.1 hypothetical protein EV195_10652 [Tenacibaculum skagerrakense]